MEMHRIFLFIVECFTLISTSVAVDKTICEPLFDLITCPIGEILQINSVLFGRMQNAPCNFNSAQISNLNCRSTTVTTQAVMTSCHGRSTCVVQAAASFLGEDPCPNTPKYLLIDYQCVVTLGSPAPGTSQPVVTMPTPVASLSVNTNPSTHTTTPTTTPLTTLQPIGPPAVYPVNTANSANNYVQKSNTGVTSCHEYLVSGARGVPDGSISASSQSSLSNNAHRGRLFTEIDTYPTGFSLEGSWTASPGDIRPWIEVKMNWLTIVHGVTTQGRHVNLATSCCREWVTAYHVRYSEDGNTWTTIQDASGKDRIFVGNTDSDTLVTNIFECPVLARYIRLDVLNYHGNASMRLELIGCPTNTPDIGSCPAGWTERPGSGTCYYISDQRDTKSWENAMVTCQRHQGHVVKLDSSAEKQWLQLELRKLQATQKLDAWWTGLNNLPRRDNTHYTWNDGTSLDPNVVDWRPMQPDNQGGVEHCASYSPTADDLEDRKCDTSLPYICELSKYWLSPIRQFNVTPPTMAPQSTTTTSPPSTVAPVTVATKLPVPVGGNVVNTGANTFTTGCLQPSDCTKPGTGYGDYASCSGCMYYLTCAPNGPFVRKCPLNLRFDANQDACSQTSSNCAGP